jgi:hypothetical protein
LLAAFLLFVALRLPNAWIHGRFMDEEGTIFLAYAWHHPAIDALFRSFGGYLNIGANATTLLTARLVRADFMTLEHAPYLTMGIALAFQALPPILILTARANWLANRFAVIAAVLIMAIGPMTEEVFFNVLHIQFHLALCTAIVLALDVPRARGTRIAYNAILCAAPLCGPGAAILLPVFVLRSLIDRDLGRMFQTTLFALATALQMLLFFERSPVRGHFIDPVTLASILFVRLQALPAITRSPANRLGGVVYRSYVAGGYGYRLAAAAALIYFATLIMLALRDRRDPAIWLLLSCLALAIASFGGGMIAVNPSDWFSNGAGERYNFLPQVLLTLGLIALATRPATRYRLACAILCALALVCGAISYRKPVHELKQGVAWTDEVAAWRRNHNHRLASWPANWTVDLSDHTRPCSPPRADALTSPDPSYCESAWLARVAHPNVPITSNR